MPRKKHNHRHKNSLFSPKNLEVVYPNSMVPRLRQQVVAPDWEGSGVESQWLGEGKGWRLPCYTPNHKPQPVGLSGCFSVCSVVFFRSQGLKLSIFNDNCGVFGCFVLWRGCFLGRGLWDVVILIVFGCTK